MLKEKLNKILKIVGGNAFSQIIVIIGTPFLTRVYEPQEFAVLAIVTSIVMVLGVVGSGRYDQLIYSFVKHNDHARCYTNGLYISCIISFLVFIVSILLFLSVSMNISYLFLAPLVFSFSLYQLYASLASIKGDYDFIVKGNLIRSFSLIFSQYALASFGAFGLVVGLLISQLLSLLAIMYFYYSKYDYKIITSPNFFDFRTAVLSSAQSLANSVSSQLPVLVIPMLFGMTALGYYSLAVRLTQLPITFFTNAIRPYVLGELNKYKDNPRTTERILTLGSSFLLGLGVLGVFLINLFSTKFFYFYAGPSWEVSGDIASGLSLWLMIAFANIIAVSYLTVATRFLVLFWYDLLLLISRVAVLLFSCFFSFDFICFIYIYSIVGMVFNLYIISYAIYTGKRNA
ncbi:oligosaccharide flippase family protein [Aeromonas sp. A-5]|uniref:oligosaccharide flippase family protein n=1 Tax=Aeromonas ichthyocola TaxID=3367746 RepID=UPI0038EB23E4